MPSDRQRWPGAHSLPLQVQSPAPQVPAEPALHDDAEVQAQPPAAHPNPGGQACPQAPQLDASVCRSRHPAGVWQQVIPTPQLVLPLHAHTELLPAFAHASPERQTSVPQVHSPEVTSHVPAAPAAEHTPFVAHPHWFFGR